MKITLTQSGIVTDSSCIFSGAIATNNSTDICSVTFYDGVLPSGSSSLIAIPANTVLNISSLGGLNTSNGLYLDIGNCSSVEVEII